MKQRKHDIFISVLEGNLSEKNTGQKVKLYKRTCLKIIISMMNMEQFEFLLLIH